MGEFGRMDERRKSKGTQPIGNQEKGSCKMPIKYWFKAIWWFTIKKLGINAVN